jgi:hypothetical protein
VQVVHENTKVQEVERVVDKIVEVVKTNVVNQKEFIVQEKVVEVPTQREIVVPQKETVREQIPVQQIIEKIIERVIEVPKLVEVEKIVEKMVEKQQIVELETIVPQLVKGQ